MVCVCGFSLYRMEFAKLCYYVFHGLAPVYLSLCRPDGRRVSSIVHSLSLAASSWKYLWKYLLLLYLTFLGNPGNVHCAYVCVGMCVYVCTCVCLPDRDACLCHREWGNKNTEY